MTLKQRQFCPRGDIGQRLETFLITQLRAVASLWCVEAGNTTTSIMHRIWVGRARETLVVWVEAMDAAKDFTLHRRVPRQRIIWP